MVEEERVFEVPRPMEHCVPLPEDPFHSPRAVVVEESSLVVVHVQQDPLLPEMFDPPTSKVQFHPKVRKMQVLLMSIMSNFGSHSKASKMAPLQVTWPKVVQGLTSENFKTVFLVDLKEHVFSDAEVNVQSPASVMQESEAWRK
ncbi:protein QUIRKY [Sesbania bispinosa]|nr:protein QUIRKY [Sesbania bispinosa]